MSNKYAVEYNIIMFYNKRLKCTYYFYLYFIDEINKQSLQKKSVSNGACIVNHLAFLPQIDHFETII